MGGVQANPGDPKVASGSATFSQNGSSLVVRNTPGAIINWQTFSIGKGEVTDFIQRSSSSTVLNRVVGVDPSLILGSLESNGHVFLINPNGMTFGAGSMVDTAGLVVSTLNLSDAAFKSGNLQFVASPTAGSINVTGVIQSQNGDVYLIAPNISNAGSISARDGNVVLAAGQSVDIVGRGLDDIHFEVQGNSNSAVNLGSLNGDAVGIFAGSIGQNGSANANAVALRGGQVVLSATGDVSLGAGSATGANGAAGGGTVLVQSTAGNISIAPGALVSAIGASGGSIRVIADAGSDTIGGTLAATGSIGLDRSGSGAGGTVEALGSSVDIQSGALIDASGDRAGGSIYVGGGSRGANSAIMNAQSTTLADGASLVADARISGNGGHVVLFGSQYNDVAGSISVQGGAQGGNGGLVETSGFGALGVQFAPLLAGHGTGHGGTWLIDPTDVTISNDANSNETVGTTFTPTGNAANINTGTLEGVVNNNGSVVISTTSAGAGTGNITVASELDFNPGAAATLTFNATGSINVNAGIFAPTGLNIVMNAGTTAASGINIAANQTIQTGGGNFTSNSGTFTNLGTITTAYQFGEGAPTFPSGNISITTHAGNIVTGQLEAGGNITLTTAAGDSLVNFSGFVGIDQNGNNPGSGLIVTTDNVSEQCCNVIDASEGSFDFVQFKTATPTRPITITNEQYEFGADAAFPGTLVLTSDLINDIEASYVKIGTSQTPLINFVTPESYVNAHGLDNIDVQTDLVLTATRMTQDNNTSITANALNLTGNSISLPAENDYYCCSQNTLAISATGTGSSPSLYLGGDFGSPMLVTNDSNTGTVGISGFNTITFSGANVTVGTSITSSGNLNLSVLLGGEGGGQLTVGSNLNATPAFIRVAGTSTIYADNGITLQGGSSTGAYAQIVAGGNSTVTSPNDINIQGGTGNGAYAVIDPANVTINSGNLNLTGGAGNGAYAAITSAGNVVVNVNGALTLTTGTGQSADAVIVAPQGTYTGNISAGCTGCVPLATNPFQTTATEAGYYAPGPPPPNNPVQVIGVSVAGTLGNYDTNEQDTTQNDLVFTGGPGDLGIAIWVIDQLCGSDS
jgi:filamentous hemagglutinin family protein